MQKISNLIKHLSFLFILMCFVSIPLVQAEQSTCYGKTHAGKIIDAIQLPKDGANFTVFSSLAWYLGRTYVHSEVYKVVIDAYQQLSINFPEHIFMYAETGWAGGKQFKPHKTHQNGLSVDFMVPVKNLTDQSSLLPVSINNRWGYDIEFNHKGQYDDYQIDFELMAEHLKLLFDISKAQGFSIKKVYFDPRLQPLLFNTSNGSFIKKNITFNQKQAWVRHDEHYHVDFDIECESISTKQNSR